MSNPHVADCIGTGGVDAFVMSRKDVGDDGLFTGFRYSHHKDVLLSFLSDNRHLQRHKEVTAVTPSAYNHPRFYTEESVHQAHSKLPVLLTQPKDHEPSLYRAVVLSEESFVHNTVPCSINALQAVNAQPGMNDDCVSGGSRGRSSYRSGLHNTLNRPRATHAQSIVNNTRRMSSVPAVYDETRHIPSRTSNMSLHNLYRKDSMMRLARSGAFNKTLGIGKGHFTLADLLVKAHELEQQREALMTVQGNAEIIRDYLRHHGDQKFNVSRAEVLRYFFRCQYVTSCGSLFVKELGRQDEDKKRVGSNNDSALRAAMLENIAQDENITATLGIHNTKGTHNYARLIIRVNCIDETVKGQPCQVVEVNITELNARKEDLDVRTLSNQKPSLSPSEIIFYDVTDASYVTQLQALFPHKRNDPEYFRKLQMSAQPDLALLLFSIPHNNIHWTKGVFSNIPDRPGFIDALASTISSRPNIFILLRASHELAIDIQADLMKDFAKQANQGQWTKLFKDKQKQQIGLKTMTPVSKLPARFSAIPEYSFITYRDFEVRTGGATVYDSQYFEPRRSYSGRAVVIPIEQTRMTNGLYSSYAFSILLDQSSLEKPKLYPGDFVSLVIEDEDGMLVYDSWSATVAAKFEWAPEDDEVCLVADRPIEDGKIADDRILHAISEGYTEVYNVRQVRSHAQILDRVVVQMKLKDSEKVCNLQLKALDQLKITERMITRNDPMVPILRNHQQLLLCNNPTRLPSTGLFDDLPKADRNLIDNRLRTTLLPHQHEVLDFWTSPSGLRDRTAVVTGIAGTGKTELMVQIALGFTGNVRVLTSTNIRRNQAVRNCTAVCRNDNENDKAVPQYPSFQEPDSEPYDSNASITERGRVSLVAATNDTVDALYRITSVKAAAHTAATQTKPLLVIRKHSYDTELRLVIKLIHSSIGPEKPLPRTFKSSLQPQPSTVSEMLNKSYVKARQRGNFKNIRDDGFELLEACAAFYVMELAMKGHDEQCPAVRAAFTTDELKYLHRLLMPIREAKKQLQGNNDTISLDGADAVRGVASIAMDWLSHKAGIICTSITAAIEDRFVVFRQPHFIGVEEFGRLGDAKVVGLFSLYPECNVRVCIGGRHQLGPQLFCEKSSNPFYDQATLSTFARLVATGFETRELLTTQRFGNEESLEVCRIANRLPNHAAARNAESELYRDMNRQLFPTLKASSTTVLLDVKGSGHDALQGADTSWRNKTTSIVSNDVLRKLVTEGKVQGKDIAVLSPYAGATALDEMLNKAHIAELGKYGQNKQLTEQFSAVRFSTIDSFTAEEVNIVIFNSISHPGHLVDLSRTAVAFTRSKLGLYFVGSSDAFLKADKMKRTHPLCELLQWFYSRKAYVVLDHTAVSRMEQYATTFEALS